MGLEHQGGEPRLKKVASGKFLAAKTAEAMLQGWCE